MGIKKDWMERQIEALANTIAVFLFGKKKFRKVLDMDEEENSETKVRDDLEDDILERMVKKLVADKEFNKAEKLIFDAIEAKRTQRRFILALNFFNEAHEFSDETLAKYDYSHDKIEKGIERLRVLYNVDEVDEDE